MDRLDNVARTLAPALDHAGRRAAAMMVLTCAIGGWITAMMRGPRRDADDFPPGQGQLQRDE